MPLDECIDGCLEQSRVECVLSLIHVQVCDKTGLSFLRAQAENLINAIRLTFFWPLEDCLSDFTFEETQSEAIMTLTRLSIATDSYCRCGLSPSYLLKDFLKAIHHQCCIILKHLANTIQKSYQSQKPTKEQHALGGKFPLLKFPCI